MTDVTKLKLYPLTAWDEVSFSRRMARVLALILPDVGDLAAAEALATNCVTVFCAVRGAIDEAVSYTHLKGELIYVCLP